MPDHKRIEGPVRVDVASYPMTVLLAMGLDETVVSKVMPLFKLVHIPAGTITLSVGECWSDLMIIQQGIFRLYYLDANGKESNKGFFREGQILAPTARVALEQPSLFYIEALTDIEAFQCDYQAMADALGSLPHRELTYRLMEDLLDEKIWREVMFLQLDAAGRYEAFVRDFPALHERIPLHHLASYLGMTDVTLSRIRARRRRLIKC